MRAMIRWPATWRRPFRRSPIRCPPIRCRSSPRGWPRPRAALLAAIAAVNARAQGGEIARPKRWGGYRVWAERLELWVGQPGRAHDRARWARPLTREGDGFAGGAWSGTRLMP